LSALSEECARHANADQKMCAFRIDTGMPRDTISMMGDHVRSNDRNAKRARLPSQRNLAIRSAKYVL